MLTVDLADEHEMVLGFGADDDRLPAQGALGEVGAQVSQDLVRDHVRVAGLPGAYVRGRDRSGIGHFCRAHDDFDS